jgi:hypothetical protein
MNEQLSHSIRAAEVRHREAAATAWPWGVGVEKERMRTAHPGTALDGGFWREEDGPADEGGGNSDVESLRRGARGGMLAREWTNNLS